MNINITTEKDNPKKNNTNKPEKYLPGSFSYIEQKIRNEATGTLFGKDFEWLCKYFLENAPTYKGLFKNVWLWDEYPDRWGVDKGIDLVAKTKDGKLWAIQAKAYSPESSIPKSELDSFLSESNRPRFHYRLIIATTNEIGKNAMETINAQTIPVGIVSRSELLKADLLWTTEIGRKTPKVKPILKFPKSHQIRAINDVLKGFKKHDRGQLIMACGTGKTLTALWIYEKLNTDLTLVLMPSLSLVAQTLCEWKKNCKSDFRYLTVCSDTTVISKDDPAIQHTSELGVPVTTDPKEISQFLNSTGKKVIFSTYQSSDCIALAQKKTNKQFDLVIADEAHRCAGPIISGVFATVLNNNKIKARKRMFMTATPRYYTERIKKQAEELEYEIASMDDENLFGPKFHTLNFGKAIKENLLSDYQIVIIGVTNKEAKEYAEEAQIVRTKEGIQTDARTLSAQIGLAKAIKKYNLKKIITFHSTINKAKYFSDEGSRDSLKYVVSWLPKSTKPTGTLWTRHISGEMPTGHRSRLLDQFRALENNEIGVLSNCACLSEGVDVPALDGVAFIDPKRSVVDIIQAVGRVIRKSEDKKIGTIVIPVFIDEKEDEDEILSSSAFEPVWKILKALRAHDDVLGDELDELRTKLGKLSRYGGKVKLPPKIKLDIPTLVLSDFEKAFYIKAVSSVSSSWETMTKLLIKYKELFGDCNVQSNNKDEWLELEKWVDNIRSLKRRKLLKKERIKQLEQIGFSWLLPGQTLTDIKGLIHEKELAKRLGTHSIKQYRDKGLIVPVGKGISSGGLTYFYKPEQLGELRKNIGITLINTKGLLNEKQFIKKTGFTKVKSYREKGLIVPVGFGLTSAGVGAYYKGTQYKDIKKSLGITLANTKGLLNENQFQKYCNLRNIPSYREKGLIKPIGYAMTAGGSVSPHYKKNQREQLKKKLRITLDSIKGLISEGELRKKYKISRITKYREKGLIIPVGWGMKMGSKTAFYKKEQIGQLNKELGITIHNTKDLVSLKELMDILDNKNLYQYIKRGEIKPCGYAMTAGGRVSPFFKKKRIKQIRKSLGITLTSVKGLLNEYQFRKKVGVHNVKKYRSNGILQPYGFAFSNGGVTPYYHPKQIKELKKKLKALIKSS